MAGGQSKEAKQVSKKSEYYSEDEQSVEKNDKSKKISKNEKR